jgi:hypothetical protein
MPAKKEIKKEMTVWGPVHDGEPLKDRKRVDGPVMHDFWLVGLARNPREALKYEVEHGSMLDAMKRVAILYFVYGILFLFFSAIGGTNNPALLAIISIFGIPVFGIIGFLVWSGVLYVIAKVLGGHGSFGTQASALSIINVFGALTAFLVVFIEFIPIVGPLAGALLAIALLIYTIYLHVLAMQETHGFDTTKGIIAGALPVVVGLIMYAILVFLDAYPKVGAS